MQPLKTTSISELHVAFVFSKLGLPPLCFLLVILFRLENGGDRILMIEFFKIKLLL
jgi:hypothetical protein